MPAPTPRTTSDLVQGIIETETGKDLSPFIASANLLTTDVCGASGYSDGFVGSKMELIERWLAAHFYTVYDNQLTATKAGTVAASFQTKTDLFLKNSMYGQQAMMLDTAGNLAAFENNAMKVRKYHVGIIWLGHHIPNPWARYWPVTW